MSKRGAIKVDREQEGEAPPVLELSIRYGASGNLHAPATYAPKKSLLLSMG